MMPIPEEIDQIDCYNNQICVYGYYFYLKNELLISIGFTENPNFLITTINLKPGEILVGMKGNQSEAETAFWCNVCFLIGKY